MKSNFLRLILACLFSLGLLLPACGPSTTTSPDHTATSEKPEYGGTSYLVPSTDIGIFDPVAQGQYMGPLGMLVCEQFLGEDWTRGAAGTGEIFWTSNTTPAPDTSMGILAESWEIPEPGTVIFKVRQGVHWALNPDSEASRLMNGREVTADDCIASFNYLMEHPRSPFKIWRPQAASTATMEKTGPWEVTLKTPADPMAGWNWVAWGGSWFYLLPPEVIEKYGDMRDWRNVVGTGPFMLTDYLAGSSATLTRNPNYWGRDPIGPGKGNQLPYLDEIKALVIPDVSTALATFRTGNHPMAAQVGAEEAKSLMQFSPKLKYRSYLFGMPAVICMRNDKAELPYKDKRVRQALMMAIDFNTLKNDLFGGEAEILAFPVTSENKRAYMPVEDMPEEAQALYRYDPDKARQLLAEANYPEGFKAKMLVISIGFITDTASIYIDMWSTVGVEVELQPVELAVFNSLAYSRMYEDMMLVYLPSGSAYPSCLELPYFMSSSIGYVNDPFIEATRQEIQKHIIINMPEADRIHRELMPYIVEQAYYIPLPTAYAYSLWWPWFKNYYGETPVRFLMYSWIDQDLKKEMAGSR
jgi:peptide/nickel transport system substrate-binding protein